MPALFIGMHLLIGSGFALYPHHGYLWLIFPIWIPFIIERVWTKVFQGIVIFAAAFGYTEWQISKLPLPKELEGQGLFQIHTIKPFKSPFNFSYLLDGTFVYFIDNSGKTYCDIPSSIFATPPIRFKGNKSYYFEGKLIKKKNHQFQFKPTIEGFAYKESFTLAELRFQVKEKIRAFLQTHFSDKKVAHFFSSLITGDIEDRTTSLELKKVGLQHLLAVSGFHFAILAGFFAYLLPFFLPQKPALFCLILVLTGYFIFIGPLPSVQRAWIAFILYYLGCLLDKRMSGLNLLGVGLILEIVSNPFFVEQIGFQLSFLATGAILLFTQPCLQLLLKFFPERKETSSMSLLDLHGYLIIKILRPILSLNFAVHLVCLPALLFLFHSFPVLSLFYNLFIPFTVSISLIFFLLSLPFIFFYPLGKILFSLNCTFTRWALDLIASPPPLLHKQIYLSHFSFSLTLFFLSLFLTIGIFLKGKYEG